MIRKEDQKVLNAFGRALREQRTKRDWTIRQLAAETGVEHHLIGKYELGQINPSLTTIARLAAGLGIGIEDFFKKS